ncbi:hypothetical protein PI125_g15201 [Phytophthora idaei]|nr:hypothetical protein PI125_g15201 [Phytophthora idaei]KAG3144195.1 hypothetical protein PI126_g14277 [Phytophthora idaei]
MLRCEVAHRACVASRLSNTFASLALVCSSFRSWCDETIKSNANVNPQTHHGTQSNTNGDRAAAISSGLMTETNKSSVERTTSNAVAANHDVMSAETNSNIVTVSHPVRVCSIALPLVLMRYLWYELMNPLIMHADDWRKKLMFEVEMGYEGFQDKCHGLFAEVTASSEAAKKRISLKDDRDIYLMPTKHGGQSKYVRLSNDNCRAAYNTGGAWRRLVTNDPAFTWTHFSTCRAPPSHRLSFCELPLDE